MKVRSYCVLLVLALLLASCQQHTRFYLSHVDKEVNPCKIERFDQDFFMADSAQLVQQYGDFLPIYLQQIVQLPVAQIPYFQRDSAIQALRYDVSRTYKDVEDIEEKLTEAWGYYHHYFPQAVIPRTLFHISGFNQSVVTTPTIVSASIENYLGSDYPMYEQIAYQYETPYMTREHLPIDMMLAWLMSEYPDYSTNLLEAMVQQGKWMYLLQVFFPDEEMAELLSYTPQQYKWCDHFEKNIWANMLEQRELFSSDWKVITRYTQPAPFTNGYSQTDSPGRLGAYIGWRIVSEYMNRNPKVSLSEMMDVTDAQQILQLSGYRP